MSEKKRILLVDDDKDFANTLKVYLSMEDYLVDVYNSPVEALKHIEEKDYHLIISDVVMPEIDGFELRNRVRTFTSTKKIPLILLTGKETEIEAINRLHDGATSFIMKPFEHSILLNEIKHLIEHRS